MKGFRDSLALRAALYTILIINVAATIRFLRFSWGSSSHAIKREYTYIGDDYPTWYDLDIGQVELDFAESVSYPMDGPASDEIWETLRSVKTHQAYVRLGPDRRVFALAMFHEMHCINMFRQALLQHDHPNANPHHVQHCINYLRQFFLCAADSTLEPYDFMERNYTTQRFGMTRVCRDWSAIYRSADENYADWKVWLKNNRTLAYERKHPKNAISSTISS